MRVQALIHESAFQHNLTVVREFAPNTQVMSVIKANAYGHGLEVAAAALYGSDAYAVARIEEAIRLRQLGISQPIVLLEGVFTMDELALAAQWQLQLVVHASYQISLLEGATSLPKAFETYKFICWLKLDTGMGRLGFSSEEAQAMFHRLQACLRVDPEIRIMTHLAQADERQNPRTMEQLNLFNHFIQDQPVRCSAANSAGIMAWPQSHYQWVRPGIMLYGVSPFPEQVGADLGLQPTMTLCTTLISIKQLKEGAQVGYGGTWVCPESMPVGVAAIGYGDGYPRHAQPGTPVAVNGTQVPLIGRVSMDMITLDLRQHAQAKVGDLVVLWGRGGPAVERVAEKSSTIAYELLCNVTQRVEFISHQE